MTTALSASVWALILAGGDGRRLQPLTHGCPKQFCSLFGGETLLDRTRRRADLLVRFDHQVVVVAKAHEPYYRYLTRELAPARLVIQPANRDTGPAIVYSLLRIAQLAGDAAVVIFPSDHYVSDDSRFIHYVCRALDITEGQPGLVVLLGIDPSSPETDYGWLELGAARLPIDGEPVWPVRRFWEKPSAATAQQLLVCGGLWHSFVVVGRVSTLLNLVDITAPELTAAFNEAGRALGSPDEWATIVRTYRKLPPVSFSQRVLARATTGVVTIRVHGVGWSDLGTPERARQCLHDDRLEPPRVTGTRVPEDDARDAPHSDESLASGRAAPSW